MARKTIEVFDFETTAYLPGVKAIVTFEPSRKMFEYVTQGLVYITTEKKEGLRGLVPWGQMNDLPQQIMKKVEKSPQLSSGMLFNIEIGYGDGISYGKWEVDAAGKRTFRELRGTIPEIDQFLLDNDMNGYLLEMLTDLNFFYNVFPEIIIDNERKKIAVLTALEASFSRWETMNPETGEIENHVYSSCWGIRQPTDLELDITPVLDSRYPLRNLKERTGKSANDDGQMVDKKEKRWIIPVSFPTPGRTYYQKPYWYSVIESGWYDLACKIPEFKNAMLDNGMAIKYHVELASDYFTKIYEEEGITTDEAKKVRRKKEMTDLNKFLSGAKNAGKSVVSYIKYDLAGKELRRMKITVIDDKTKDGLHNDDLEEASNIMFFGIGVHPSLVGATPGKGTPISGTNARELFIIKQAMLKPIRDRILMPIRIVQSFNAWDPTIEFVIPNIVLTTLDKGTGSEKVIS